MDVTCRDISFPSADGRSTITGHLWLPATQARGIVQLVHGMCEHIERYDEFACFLAQHGFAVCGHNHIGHGGSCPDPALLGHMPVEGGLDTLIADVHSMRQLASRELGPGLPYFIFAHSMGSFVTRCYLSQHAAGLSGVVLCGTGNLPRLLSKTGSVVCRVLAKLCGESFRSTFVDSMAAGGYGKKIKGATDPLAWIAASPRVIEDYKADPQCGFMFTVGGYAAVMAATNFAASRECVEAYPKDLPLLFVAGKGDPVGEFGKGVRAAAELAESAGVRNVTTIIYEGMRHEILNEDERAQPMGDILTWIEQQL